MIALTLLPVLFSLSAYASPAGVACSGCSTADATVALPATQTALVPAPGKPINFIALGVGVQNYTCGNTSTYTSTGAVAELVDISCLYRYPSVFNDIQDVAMKAWSKAPQSVTADKLISKLSEIKNPIILGQHYFITNPVTGTGLSPRWDFTSHYRNPNAFVVAAKSGDIVAPTGKQDVDWLSLNAVPGQGQLADQIFRTDTRLGQPPATCTPGSADISVRYVAKYWFLGGTIKK